MRKKCGKCGGKAFRRINRYGYLEENVLPSFGIYPWECVICRIRKYFRDDGHREVDPQTGEFIRRPTDQPAEKKKKTA